MEDTEAASVEDVALLLDKDTAPPADDGNSGLEFVIIDEDALLSGADNTDEPADEGESRLNVNEEKTDTEDITDAVSDVRLSDGSQNVTTNDAGITKTIPDKSKTEKGKKRHMIFLDKKHHLRSPGFKAMRAECAKKVVRAKLKPEKMSLQLLKTMDVNCTIFMRQKRPDKTGQFWTLMWVFATEEEAQRRSQAIANHSSSLRMSNTMISNQDANPTQGRTGYLHLDKAPPVKSLIFLSGIPPETNNRHIYDVFSNVFSVTVPTRRVADDTGYAWLTFHTHRETVEASKRTDVDILGHRVSLWLITFPAGRGGAVNAPVELQTLIKRRAATFYGGQLPLPGGNRFNAIRNKPPFNSAPINFGHPYAARARFAAPQFHASSRGGPNIGPARHFTTGSLLNDPSFNFGRSERPISLLGPGGFHFGGHSVDSQRGLLDFGGPSRDGRGHGFEFRNHDSMADIGGPCLDYSNFRNVDQKFNASVTPNYRSQDQDLGPICQLCDKPGHTAKQCLEEKVAQAAQSLRDTDNQFSLYPPRANSLLQTPDVYSGGQMNPMVQARPPNASGSITERLQLLSNNMDQQAARRAASTSSGYGDYNSGASDHVAQSIFENYGVNRNAMASTYGIGGISTSEFGWADAGAPSGNFGSGAASNFQGGGDTSVMQGGALFGNAGSRNSQVGSVFSTSRVRSGHGGKMRGGNRGGRGGGVYGATNQGARNTSYGSGYGGRMGKQQNSNSSRGFHSKKGRQKNKFGAGNHGYGGYAN